MVELVINDVGVVDGSVDVADGGCAAIVNSDVVGRSGDGRLGSALSRCSKVVVGNSTGNETLPREFCCMTSAVVSGVRWSAGSAVETSRRVPSR